ncbi:MAG TPA: galactose-1-phosphate uridylyltransferase [Bryobacteraceae bacterium]|nr:galactose-1-phosphate uridylyltransferase [Bryobacteraceae bacterium]
MNELRWHPLLREWVAVAAHRQDRPQMPTDWCPFCPGSGRVPETYDVWLYPNDFAAFQPDNPPFAPQTGVYQATGARGFTDVVLYHPAHDLLPSQMSAEHWQKVIHLWTSRYRELAANPDVRYVYIFENTGQAIGVTMPHPHGQIYAFPFLPPQIQRELDSASEHFSAAGECLYCSILVEEMTAASRLVVQNDSFVAFVPYWARYPAEVQIYSRRHCGALPELHAKEVYDLAAIVKTVRMKYDSLFGFSMPLMMILRQNPVSGEHPYFHFHIDLLPIQRSPSKLKYLAGVESGAGTFLNDTVAEERAEILRAAEPATPG